MHTAYGHRTMALSLMCYGKVPQTKHCSLWNRIQAWKSHCSISAWISSVACWLAATPFWLLTNSICTRDATSSHEADGNKSSIITSNKQDAINCLPHQLKCVPWYSMRTWSIIFNGLTYWMPMRRDELSGKERITGWSPHCSAEARLIHNYTVNPFIL